MTNTLLSVAHSNRQTFVEEQFERWLLVEEPSEKWLIDKPLWRLVFQKRLWQSFVEGPFERWFLVEEPPELRFCSLESRSGSGSYYYRYGWSYSGLEAGAVLVGVHVCDVGWVWRRDRKVS